MTEASFWWVNTVTVQPYAGTRSTGAEAYGDGETVACWVEDETKLIRDGSGSQVVSSARIYAPLEVAAKFPVGSKVTTAARTAFVLTTHTMDSGSLGLGVDHLVVELT